MIDPVVQDAKRAELTAELRKARGWILAVGLIQFVLGMIIIHAVYGDQLPSSIKNQVTMYNAIILGAFVALWWFAQYKPKLCCILALVVFWGVHLYEASADPSALYKGILIKVLFTVALINGIRSASRAESLQKELEEVFG